MAAREHAQRAGVTAVLGWLGRRSGPVLLAGLFVAALMPLPAVFAQSLPLWVAGLIGVALARMEPLSASDATPRALWSALALIAFLPLSTIAFVSIWQVLALPQVYILPLIAFLAAPPISGAANLCLILGYDARVALQATVVATLATPLIAVICVAALGIDMAGSYVGLALKVTGIVLAGVLLGLWLRRTLGTSWIAANHAQFDGVSVLLMVMFLFPVFDGAIALGMARPDLALGMAALALVLNLGGHIAVRALAGRSLAPPTARAAGLCFGNRNRGLYLAILPFEPGLSLFVALYQVPMYITPLLFRRLDR